MIGYLSHTNADPKKLCPHILKNELYRKYTPKKLYIAIFSIFRKGTTVNIPAITNGDTNLNMTDRRDQISKSPLLLKINKM